MRAERRSRRDETGCPRSDMWGFASDGAMVSSSCCWQTAHVRQQRNGSSPEAGVGLGGVVYSSTLWTRQGGGEGESAGVDWWAKASNDEEATTYCAGVGFD